MGVKLFHLARGKFTTLLMKLKLQGPSLEQAPSKALRGVLAMFSPCHIFCKICKIRYLKFSRLSVITVFQAVR